MNIKLRNIDVSDANFLCSIFAGNKEYYNIFFDDELNVDNWENRIKSFMSRDEWHHFIIENHAGLPLGWFAYEETSQIRTLIIIVLKKEYLGLGYGSAVMETFLNDCRKNRIRTIYLNVNENNIRAIQYYKKFGFEIYDLEIVSKTNNKINNREYKMKLEMH